MKQKNMKERNDSQVLIFEILTFECALINMKEQST